MHAVGLVEGAIRLVSHGIGRSCIYYCLVKMKERVLLGAARLRHLLQHRIQSNAEETPLLKDVVKKLVIVHSATRNIRRILQWRGFPSQTD